MPVEALAELVSYRELVLEVAKEVFFSRHQGRQRLPRGFRDRLQLRLSRVEAGSAIPILERVSTEEQDAMLPREDEFTAARELIERAIIAVARGDSLPRAFPADAVGYFNRFGRTLQEGESIRLSRPGARRVARYTSAVRRELLLSRERTYRSNREAIGRIVEIDAEASTFTLRTLGREAVMCHFESELFSFIRGVLQPDGAGPVVLVEGEAVLDDRDKILRMHVAEAALDDDPEEVWDQIQREAPPRVIPPDVPQRALSPEVEGSDSARVRLLLRLHELESLRDGWLDGKGRSPAAGVIRALRAIADKLTAEGLPSIRLYPTPEGGVQMEWRSGGTERSVEVKADLGLYAVELDTATGEAREREERRPDPGALARSGQLRQRGSSYRAHAFIVHAYGCRAIAPPTDDPG
jgi:hypothetical protein